MNIMHKNEHLLDIPFIIAQETDVDFLSELLRAQPLCTMLLLKIYISKPIQKNIILDIPEQMKCIDIELRLECSAQAQVIIYLASNILEQVHCTIMAAAESKMSLASIISTNQALNLKYKLYAQGYKASITHAGAYTVYQGGSLTIQHDQYHAREYTYSNAQLYGKVEGKGNVSFDGLISIAHDAVWADAALSHKSLLSSDQAYVRSVPNLEIKTNDVSCKHATAVECIDEEHLFYLMARGFSREYAKRMISQGFCTQAFDQFEDDVKKECLQYAHQKEKYYIT